MYVLTLLYRRHGITVQDVAAKFAADDVGRVGAISREAFLVRIVLFCIVLFMLTIKMTPRVTVSSDMIQSGCLQLLVHITQPIGIGIDFVLLLFARWLVLFAYRTLPVYLRASCWN